MSAIRCKEMPLLTRGLLFTDSEVKTEDTFFNQFSLYGSGFTLVMIGGSTLSCFIALIGFRGSSTKSTEADRRGIWYLRSWRQQDSGRSWSGYNHEVTWLLSDWEWAQWCISRSKLIPQTVCFRNSALLARYKGNAFAFHWWWWWW